MIEPSAGGVRATLAFLCEAYHEDRYRTRRGNPERVVLESASAVVPIKAAVFPLVKKDGMPEMAAEDLSATQAAVQRVLR